MNKIEQKFMAIRQFCEANTNPENVKKYARFFTEGYDAYGLGRVVFETQRDLWLEAWKHEMSFQDYLDLGDTLIATGKYEEASFAITFVYHQSDKFSAKTFDHLGKWLDNGILNWGHTDVLSGMGLASFFTKHILEIEAFTPWTQSASVWKRRSVPVTLVEIVKTDISIKRILAIIESLMLDKEKKVQQGLGWLLREAWKKEPALIEAFLMKWKDTCGRTIIQYATEKMTKEYRIKFRKEKG